GVWKQKDGDAFYAAALHASTTTNMTPDEVHKLGLDQAKEIAARIDAILKGMGMTQGTVGQRITALYKDTKSFFPNTDAGKADAVAFCNAQLDKIRPKLPTAFARIPQYQFEIRRVPPSIEAGAPLAYSQPPSLDGSRPGIVYFNLKDTGDWP